MERIHNQTRKEVTFITEDIKKGKLHQIKDKAREESGKLTGNKSEEMRGAAENVAGKAQEQYGKAKESIKKAIGD
jgi:uncharacterized protein YjbJ (UPF0337 family)